MLALDKIPIWEKLDGPYGNSGDIPNLLLTLAHAPSKTIADELVWEYIYHQGSVYENTLATVPHLIQIIQRSANEAFNLDLLISLGIVLWGFDGSSDLASMFQANVLSPEEIADITEAFMAALPTFRQLVDQAAPLAKQLPEDDKRFYLVAYLVSRAQHQAAEVFKVFSGNDEYMFVCPHCAAESFLENEQGKLQAYDQDPILTKSQRKLAIDQHTHSQDLQWLQDLVTRFEIHSLAPLLPYFAGQLACHQCQQTTNVFAGIMHSL
jgi:hypothetical protein